MAEAAPQPKDMPRSGLSEALSHHATWVESECLPGRDQRQRQVQGAPSRLPESCELPFPSGLQEKLGIHMLLWKDTRTPEGLKVENNPPLQGLLNFYRTAKLLACSCKNRS